MEPRFSITPQPIIAEILSGFATIIAIGAGYCFKNHKAAEWILELSTSKVIGIGAAMFVASWLVGTFLDVCRDVIEWFIDLPPRWQLNWQYLITAPAEDVERLNDWYLAYYLLSFNCFIGTIAIFLFTRFGLIAFPSWALVTIVVFSVANLIGAILTRIELREIMGLGLPHERVFTRLRPSKVYQDGVGVFAIQPIKKNTYLFEPDDLPLVQIDASRVEHLPKKLRQLYYDFGTLNGGKYTVPTSLNKLTVSWYLNEAARPDQSAGGEQDSERSPTSANVKCGKDLRFYAATDIEPDTELLVDYDEYCERPPDVSE